MAGISLNGAYNHFIQDYVSKDVTQADAHRKDELRDVYKSIAKINKKSQIVCKFSKNFLPLPPNNNETRRLFAATCRRNT